MTHTHTEAAILAALDETQPGEFIAWAPIRDDLHVDSMLSLRALVGLVDSGDVEVVKVRGRNYIARADEFSTAARVASGRPSILVA